MVPETVQRQQRAYCGAHALNNLIHHCPKKNEFVGIQFTFDKPNIASTATRINLNNICEEIKLTFLRENYYLLHDNSIDTKRLKLDYPTFKNDFDCFPSQGHYSENVVLQALRLVGLHNKQIWRKNDPKSPTNETLTLIIQEQVPYGYLINTSNPGVDHWVCAVFIGGSLKVIDSLRGGSIVDFSIQKRFNAIYILYK